MKGIKAFTIVELIMVFIISSLVISLSVGVVLFIFRIFEGNQSSISAKTEALSLVRMMENDMDFYLDDLSVEGNKILIANGKGNISYIFDDLIVKRSEINTNTHIAFKIPDQEFAVHEFEKGLKLELWTPHLTDTLNIYHIYSNRNYCKKKGYTK